MTRQSEMPHIPRNMRGQMEIMGLAIIVVLITLGVLFAITTLSKEEAQPEKEFEQQNLAAGFLNTFLGTNTACMNATVRDLIRDCAQRGTLECPPGSDPKGDGRTMGSCVFINETAHVIFNRTLDVRRSKYYLTAKGPYMDSIWAGEPCRGEQVFKQQPIPTRSGTVTIELRICG